MEEGVLVPVDDSDMLGKSFTHQSRNGKVNKLYQGETRRESMVVLWSLVSECKEKT